MHFKRQLLLLLLIFLFINSNAQKDFYPGYILTLDEDTIHGQIMDRGDKYMGEICHFKNTDNEIIKYLPTKIKGYRINNKYFLTKKAFDKDAFMEVLFEGDISLYYLRIGSEEHFFIDNADLGLKYLEYKENLKHLNNSVYQVTSIKHIAILKYYMMNAKNIHSAIDKISKPEYKQLYKLFEKYYNHKHYKEQLQYKKELPLTKVFLEPIFRKNWALPTKSHGSFSEKGIHFWVWLPRSNEKLYFKTGFSMSSEYKVHGGYQHYNVRIYKIPIQFQYFLSKKKVTPKIVAGTNVWIFNTDAEGVSSLTFPFNVGLGLNYKLSEKVYFSLSSEADFVFSENKKLYDNSNTSLSLGFGLAVKL